MVITQDSPTALTLKVALQSPRTSSTGKSQLVVSDRAKAFVKLADGSEHEVTLAVNGYFKG